MPGLADLMLDEEIEADGDILGGMGVLGGSDSDGEEVPKKKGKIDIDERLSGDDGFEK